MPTLGPTELIILLVIVLVIFGGGRIGELGGALGKGIREFKSSVRDEEGEAEAIQDPDEKPVPAATVREPVVEKTTVTTPAGSGAGASAEPKVTAATPTTSSEAAAAAASPVNEPASTAPVNSPPSPTSPNSGDGTRREA